MTMRLPNRGTIGMWRHVRAFLCLAAITFAGCGDSGPFDPVATDNAVDDVIAAITNNQALQALSVLNAAFPAFAGAQAAVKAAPPVVPPNGLEVPGWATARARLLKRAIRLYAPAEPAVLFPADLLGKTFVYNPATEMYEVALERTGAPANGVRLILYAVDPVGGRVVTPLIEIGYLDFTDKSTPAADAVGIRAVINDVMVLDYDASASITTSSVTFTAIGMLTDGTTRVDFTLSQTFSETEGITIDYDASAPSEGARIRLQVNADPQGASATFIFTIQHGGSTVVLNITGYDTSVTGTVQHNGETVIEISGTPLNPVFTDVSGNPLTPEQLIALKDLFESAGGVLQHFDDLIEPAHRVLQVSFFFSL